MHIRYGCEISIAVDRPTATVAMVDVHPHRQRDVTRSTGVLVNPAVPVSFGSDAFGNLICQFLARPGETTLFLEGTIFDYGQLDRRDAAAVAVPIDRLSHEVLTFLNGSRYCETDKLGYLAWNTFGHLAPGLGMVQAICDFVHQRLTFDYQQARSTRTAAEAYEEGVGVCRDFTHLAVAFCRCMNIPARYVNGYLGDIGVAPDPAPMDFNAWFEVYLGGHWYTFDARHNERRIGRIPIARGRDACDIPMLQTFGPHQLRTFKVFTEEVVEPARSIVA